MGMQAFETTQEIALVVDADAELAHWRSGFRELPHCRSLRWDEVKPALKLGIDACLKANGRDLTEMVEELETRYQRTGNESRLSWSQAREIVAIVWVRIWEQSRSRPATAALAPVPAGRMSMGLRAR
ncbi:MULTISPECIES: hypothetical protein [Lysobacter]|uniref:Uncharacterized protein n=1 Tax=Lysobacter yananisis TaxID=1003114 RepID=A0ABY9P2I8_9GAMM|nr:MULTISPECIES: hypothetical protein [Lysobacter]QQQ02777.1 hypothetical protein JHW41_07350 [Lysobacter enzymogenes]WMT01178.1 hypothetical protein RDV84_14350 [Lysobacter yananisis]